MTDRPAWPLEYDPTSEASSKSLWTSDVIFAVFALGIALFWLQVLLQRHAPSGGDPGNWLALGNRYFGIHIRSSQVTYPPIVPALVATAVRVAGPTVGVALMGVFAGLVPGIVLYVVLRGAVPTPAGAFISALVLPGSHIGEVIAWGGFPQLIGIGALIAVLATFDTALIEPRRRHLINAAVAWLLLIATSHFLAAVGGVWVVSLVLLHVSARATRATLGRSLARLAPVVAVISLPLVPMYWTLASGAFTTSVTENRAAPLSLVDGSRLILRERWPLWLVALIIALVSPLLSFHRRDTHLWRVATSAIVATFVVCLTIPGFRFFYLVPEATALGVALALYGLPVRGWLTRVAVCASLAISLAVVTTKGVDTFPRYRAFYNLLTQDMTSQVIWLRHTTPAKSLIAMPAVHGLPVGWWVEGLGERRTLVGSNPRWLVFDDERRRAAIANSIFSASTLDDALARARSANVDYLFIPVTADAYMSLRLSDAVHARDPNIVKSSADVVVLRVPSR